MSGRTDGANGVCRCCLGVGRFRSLGRSYNWLGTKERYDDMLMSCFNISTPQSECVEVAGVGRAVICAVCVARLRDAYNFKRQIQRSRRRFANVLRSHGVQRLNQLLLSKPPQPRVKLEPVDEDTVEDEGLEAADQSSNSPHRGGEVDRRDDAESYRNERSVGGDDGSFMLEGMAEVEEQVTDYQENGAVGAEAAAEEWEGAADDNRLIHSDQDVIIAIEIAEDVEPKTKSSDGEAATVETNSKTRSSLKRKCKRELEDADYVPEASAPKKIVKVKRKAPVTESRQSPTVDATAKDAKQTEERWLKRNAAVIISNSEVCPFKCSYNVYRCFYCAVEYEDPAELRSHTALKHATDKHEVYKNIQSYYQVSVDVTDLSCGVCEETALDLEDLIEHLKSRHGKNINSDYGSGVIPYELNVGTLRCYVCKLKFYTFQILRIHMNEHFSNYPCYICGYAYASRSRLERHMLTHEKGAFECELCGKMYDSHTKRRSHIEAVHERKFKLICRICNARFKHYSQKVQHQVLAHGQEPMRFSCQFCDNVYATKRILANHMRRDHYKVRNHKCLFCEKSFYMKSQLDNHVVVHTGERNFQCDECDKTFNRKANLASHVALHTGVRPYCCDICQMRFITSGHLKWHKRNRHTDALLYY